MIRAAIKDVPYENPPPSQEEPCEQQYCAWGGECLLDEAGVAYCTCPTNCPGPSATTSPVCGTDGQTYPTICQLRLHACTTSQEIRISHTGACDDPVPTFAEERTYRTRTRNRGSVSENAFQDRSRIFDSYDN